MSSHPGATGGGVSRPDLQPELTPTPTNDPSRWVDEHGDVLYRYALDRVRKPEVAQDLVQETFLAAVRSQERFRGGSTVRSWLCGILKHKICDYYRKRGRETSFTDLEFLSDECAVRFVPEGYWVHMNGPKEWKPEADEVMHRDESWKTMRDCLGKLPERVATVFMMREMDEVESKDVCATLMISESNLWVMLHRARMALRECLAMNWFENRRCSINKLKPASEWTPNPRPPDDTSTLQEHRNWLQLQIVLLICRLTPSCPEVVRLLSLGMDKQLSFTMRLKLRIHYLMCSFCERYMKQLKYIREVSREFLSKIGEISNASLTADGKERMKAAIRE